MLPVWESSIHTRENTYGHRADEGMTSNGLNCFVCWWGNMDIGLAGPQFGQYIASMLHALNKACVHHRATTNCLGSELSVDTPAPYNLVTLFTTQYRYVELISQS